MSANCASELDVGVEIEGKLPNVTWAAAKAFANDLGISKSDIETAFKCKVYYDTEDFYLTKHGIDLRTQYKRNCGHAAYKHQIKIPLPGADPDSPLAQRVEISWSSTNPIPDLSELSDRAISQIENTEVRAQLRRLKIYLTQDAVKIRAMAAQYTRRRVFNHEHHGTKTEYAHAQGFMLSANGTVIPFQIMEAELKGEGQSLASIQNHFNEARLELGVSHSTTESIIAPAMFESEWAVRSGMDLPNVDFWNLTTEGGWSDETLQQLRGKPMRRLLKPNQIRRTGAAFSGRAPK